MPSLRRIRVRLAPQFLNLGVAKSDVPNERCLPPRQLLSGVHVHGGKHERSIEVFDCVVDGLAYTVTIYEQDGAFFADINVVEGAMDVNAVYFGDDDFSGPSAGLRGPLNMNGAGSRFEGEHVQWDDAIALSSPGLGREGADKETYISEGETLSIPLSIESLDDIEYFGVRATSTTNAEGSIKGVSGDAEFHEEPDERDEPDEPQDPTFDKVFFTYDLDGFNNPASGFAIEAEEPDPNPFNLPALPEGTEPTFENYVSYFEEIGGDFGEIETVILYETDDDSVPQELFRLDAPEEGFADADALLDAFDEALDELEAGSDHESSEALDLMAAISLAADSEDEMPAAEDDLDEEPELVL